MFLRAVNIKEDAVAVTGWGPLLNFSKFHAGITREERFINVSLVIKSSLMHWSVIL